jgi:sterol 3beta-glucosyltransferase
VRILLLTAGSRGDVDPFLALAERARAAGHAVQLGMTRDFVAQGRAAGLDVAALDGDYSALVARQGVTGWAAMRSFRSVVRPMMASILRSAADAALAWRPDVIVYHPKVLSAPIAAALLGIPHVLVEIVPTMTPTREFPAAGVTTWDVGPLNRLTYRATVGAAGMFAGVLHEIRDALGVPRHARLPAPAVTLVPVSPTLLLRPADWPADIHITGAWHGRASDAQLTSGMDNELEEFLAVGNVVYAGFGSMAAGDPVARGRTVVDAARRAGYRLLAVTGWGGLDIAPDLAGDDVLVRRAVSHTSVLPRCSLAVHHAGAGTTHAVVRAGVVSIAVPFLADQPFWGGLLHRRGFGAAPVRARRLTADRLGAALATLPDDTRVKQAAQAMRAEDGCASALDVLERLPLR